MRPPNKSIPVTVIVITKNEERRIVRCLQALARFDEVIVVDSNSTDRTRDIARECGARVENFSWNGRYPKKRQWCLDHLKLQHDWVFFVDADEVVTAELAAEIAALDFAACGYFVRGRYVVNGKMLRFGLVNNKLALIDRRRMMFPIVDDLGLPGMGEIEGHYQPVPIAAGGRIGQLKAPLIHYAYEDEQGWQERHQRYAAWERGMNERGAWPAESSRWRQGLKALFRALKLRDFAAFVHCYIFKFGFLDGTAGWDFARSRAAYYRMISAPSTSPAERGGNSTKRAA